jgi:hypothetical protein
VNELPIIGVQDTRSITTPPHRKNLQRLLRIVLLPDES